MIYYANLRLPKAPNYTAQKCYTQEVIDRLIRNINETAGHRVIAVTEDKTETLVRVEINTDITDQEMLCFN